MIESTDDVDVDSTITFIKFCVGLGKSPRGTIKLIRSSETTNPCSLSVVYKWHERFRKGRKSTEDDSRDGSLCVVKMTMTDITFRHVKQNR